MSRADQLNEDLITAEQFYCLTADGQKADLLDGVMYMASPESCRSNDLTGFVSFLVRGYDAARELGGRVFVSRYAFRLSDIRAPEPDVAYVRKVRLHLVEHRWMQGGPDVGVEIVSRDSHTRDYVEKRLVYQEAGVSEYWIIDPIQQRVEFLRLQAGRYELVPLESNRIFRSEMLPGFWLDVEWLLADPLPNAWQCLQRVLAGKP